MELYPIFVKLDAKPVLVVGGGSVGRRKVMGLLAAGARVTLVSPAAHAELQKLAAQGRIDWRKRGFEPGDLAGMRLAVVATDDRSLNESIAAAATERGVLLNVADVPDLCDFYLGSVVKRGPLKIAISTAGAAPALARRIRQELETQFPESFGDFVAYLGDLRERVKRHVPGQVMAIAEQLAASAAGKRWLDGEIEPAKAELLQILTKNGVPGDDDEIG